MNQWLWDEKRRIYVDRFGDRLTDKEIREALDEYIESTQKGIAKQVAKFTSKEITTPELFMFLEEEVAAIHGASGSLAYGGIEQMGLREWDRINQKVLTEQGYLMNFKGDVYAAQLTGSPLSAEGIANRAGLYIEGAYAEYMNQVVERESDNGVIMGRRITEGDGSVCDDCDMAATEEFIPLDEILEIGSLQCGPRCRCEIEFGDEDSSFRTSDLFGGVISGQDAYGGDVEIQ